MTFLSPAVDSVSWASATQVPPGKRVRMGLGLDVAHSGGRAVGRERASVVLERDRQAFKSLLPSLPGNVGLGTSKFLCPHVLNGG